MSWLPNEIWQEIFRWATLDNQYIVSRTHTIPFQSRAINEHDRATLEIKRNLSLVCRLWKQMVIELLYRDIRIAHGAKGLREALQTKTADGTNSVYGDWVRRVVLPFSSTITGPDDSSTFMTSIDILALCPKLKILVRPPHDVAGHELRFYSEAQQVLFPSLEHLEWWHNNDAERTGGINSLSAVLCAAPNLSYLFIAGLPGHIKITPRPVSLPLLTTLRLRNVDGFLLHDIVHRWTLPALTHLILDAPTWYSQSLLTIWEKFGAQLRSVELGRHLRFLQEDILSPCLRGCPSLEEINYYVLFTAVPGFLRSHYSLKVVGLHYASNSYLPERGSFSGWSSLEQHFNLLLNLQLPSLQHIVLYGDWGSAVADPRFKAILERSVRRGCFIVYPDGSRVPIN